MVNRINYQLIIAVCILLFFGFFVPKIYAQTFTSNKVCTKIGNAPGDTPCKRTENFVFYCQGNTQWQGNAYACETIGGAGCGPTSVAMIASTLLGKAITPPEVAQAFTSAGASVCHQGSSIPTALGSNWFAQLGLKSGTNITVSGGKGNVLNLDVANQLLQTGTGLILASSDAFPCANCRTPGVGISHIFVVDQVDVTNKTVRVRDPNNCSYRDGNDENPDKMVYKVDAFNWKYAYPIQIK